MTNSGKIEIPLPTPDREHHHLFEISGAAVQRWVETLPKANLGETTRLLYKALKQFNQVICSPTDRLAALEKLRPVTHQAQKGMQRYYLNKPIVLSEKAHRVVELCDFLNRQLATGYSLVATQLIQRTRSRLEEDALATALHRALTEHAVFLLRRYQLYSDPAPEFWRLLHRLYYLALSNELSQRRVEDRVLGDCTIKQSYLRPLMLATAQPQQLSQKELANVFVHLADWSGKIALKAGNLSDCTFIFHPTDEQPPGYRQCREVADGMLGIATGPLCEHLKGRLKHSGRRQAALKSDDNLDSLLVEHLHAAWSDISTRESKRREKQGVLKVALGMSSTHFFIAGRTAFQDFVDDEDDGTTEGNPFQRPVRDVWSQSLTKDTFKKDEHKERPPGAVVETIDFTSARDQSSAYNQADAFPLYDVNMVNVSRRGFCLKWPNSEAVKLKTGEIIGISEPQAPHWSIGILRWIKKADRDFSHVGVEILGVTAEPYSARLLQSGQPKGHSQRAFLLPADTVTGISGRILLPRPAFKAGQSLELRQPAQRLRVQLTERTMTTRLFSLFAYKALEGSEKPLDDQQTRTRDDSIAFDSLWNQL